MQAADLVISMGGYNTICEILTQQTPALIIPRETPRKEQLIRAQCLKGEGLIDYLSWHEITPQKLREKIFSTLDRKEEYEAAMSNFQLTGIDTMLKRLAQFRTQSSGGAAVPAPESAALQP
jgi:predicted glycosyltransferase